MSNDQLYAMQAGRIETVFSAHRINARVWQATVSPRFVRFDVTTALGTRLSAAERLEEELAMSLGAQSVRVYRDRGVIYVEVPREGIKRSVDLQQILQHLAATKHHMPEATALLGIGEDGSPLMLRIPSPDVAHALIAGSTGSGKTELLRTIVASLAMRNPAGRLQCVLIDPKGYRLRPFAELPHVRTLATTADEAAVALEQCVGDMERRRHGALPRIIIVIDELADLVMTDARIVTSLTRITQRGREAGVHVLAATQRPAAALVGGMMKANFPVRLVGSVTSPEDAKVASGRGGTGAERLLGRGDFLLIARGDQTRFQAAYADDAELGQIVDAIGRVVRRPIAPAAPATDPGGVGSGVGIVAPAGLFPPALAIANPTPPHPTPPARTPLRSRYTRQQLRDFIAAANGSLSEAAQAAFSYKDSATLAIMREALED